MRVKTCRLKKLQDLIQAVKKVKMIPKEVDNIWSFRSDLLTALCLLSAVRNEGDHLSVL